MSPEPRRYSDEEAAVILRRAAVLGEGGGGASAGGFTLAQLQEIAAEAGIDPGRVADAAAGLPIPAADPWGRVLGAPTRFRFARVVEGTLPDPAWERVVDEVRAALRAPGHATLLPGRLEWRSDDEAASRVQLRVSRGAGATRVELDADLRGTASLALTLPTVGAAVLGMIATQVGIGWGEGAELWTALTAAGGGTAAGWGLWRHLSRRWQRRLERLMGQLVRAAAAGDPPSNG